MSEDFYDFEDEESESRGRGHLFLWSLFILFEIALAFVCWLGSFYIFGHPEEPRPYKFLQKLHKLEPPKRFELTAAPTGDFVSPQQLFDRYSRLSPLQLKNENAQLLRDYLKNYRETKALVPYATGHYEIIAARALGKDDLFTSGVVALAVATDRTQVLIEHLYPTAPENVDKLLPLMSTGYDLRLKKMHDLAAVIHVERTPGGRFLFTVVPLAYGDYALNRGVGTFGLEPPLKLNVVAGAPIYHGAAVEEAVNAYAEFRRSRPAVVGSDDAAKSTGPEIVRLDDVQLGAKVPESGALPEMPVATPIPVGSPKPGAPTQLATTAVTKPGGAQVGKPGSTAATPPKLALNATPKPGAATPPALTSIHPASSTPLPSAPAAPATPALAAVKPAPGTPDGVLKPFIAAMPEQNVRPAAKNWRMYEPGQQPAGRAITAADAAPYAERGELGERLYLRGSFIVSYSGPNWAVLHPQAAGGKGSPGVRVIIDFPASAEPPPEGATFSRDELRAFQIDQIRRGADGLINITGREVTQP